MCREVAKLVEEKFTAWRTLAGVAPTTSKAAPCTVHGDRCHSVETLICDNCHLPI
jgi:hypothetical protein